MSKSDAAQAEERQLVATLFPGGSPLLPVTRQKIDRLREAIKEDKLAPSLWFNSRGVEIAGSHGKTVSISGCRYEGTPVLVFWKSVEPFLEDAIVHTLDDTLDVCLSRKWEPEAYIREAAMLLDGHLIDPIYRYMAGIDRRLRGKGNPKSVKLRDVTNDIVGMRRFLDKCREEMIRGVKAADLGGSQMQECRWPVLYDFSPRVFVIEPQTSFHEAWEVFCCEMLNLHFDTTEICRRTPPDRGVDLHWAKRRMAWQCKSVGGERSPKFRTDGAMKSMKDALKSQTNPLWEKYFICSNVDLTGSQQDKLRRVIPGVEFLTPTFWTSVCRKHPVEARKWFRS
jgi:hypothetical protein